MSRRAANLVAVILALVWIFPVYWMINTALLPVSQSRSSTPTFFSPEATSPRSPGSSPPTFGTQCSSPCASPSS